MDSTFDKTPQREHDTTTDKFAYNRDVEKAIITANASILMTEKDWITQILKQRIAVLIGEEAEYTPFHDLTPPAITEQGSAYGQLVQRWSLSAAERVLLMTTLLPYFSPATLTTVLREESGVLKVKYPELGGLIDNGTRQFIPSMQTVLFLLSGPDEESAVYYDLFFREKSLLFKEGVIRDRPVFESSERANLRNQLLVLSQDYLDYLVSGRKPTPGFDRQFPAQQVETSLEWSDLVLPPSALEGLEQMLNWIEQVDVLRERSKKFNLSSPCLFYGPPGTGKTLTAKLTGKKFNREVYRIDLSMVVSKYVGETEKNLAYLFDRAEGKDWILFFDEADSLFSRRTQVGSANDKWANLEVSYLLQRMEQYTGLTILSSNLKGNIDRAMVRRFKYMINFPRPEKAERLKLWHTSLPEYYHYAEHMDFEQLASVEVTGANISNIIMNACAQAEKAKTAEITPTNLLSCIRYELHKEDRTV